MSSWRSDSGENVAVFRAGADINVLSCYPVLNLEFPGTVCVSENVMHVTHSAAARISPLIMAVCKKNHETAKFLLRYEIG